jgi:hypothetical protein
MRPTCDGCGMEIDPDVCGCGDSIDGRLHDGHTPVPVGCICYRTDIGDSEPKPKSVFNMVYDENARRRRQKYEDDK